MINLPPVRAGSQDLSTAQPRQRDRVEASTNTQSRDKAEVDRRFRRDRRRRRGEKWVMDRRTGADRRRASLHFKV